MQGDAEHIEGLRNTKTSCMRQRQKQGGQRPSGPSCRHPLPASEIRIFLQEWKVVERNAGHPGKKIYQKSWAIYQRLNGYWDLKKSWESCVDLLLTLQNLHRRLCNGRGDTISLFSFSEDLFSIMGCFPCPLYHEGFGNHLHPENPQPFRDQPGDHCIPVPSAQLQRNPLPMMSQGNS
nr:uncharacterized protein LOC121831781 [Peromyscus maniculatus bairdii]